MFTESVEDIVKGEVITEEERKFLIEEYGLEENNVNLENK